MAQIITGQLSNQADEALRRAREDQARRDAQKTGGGSGQ
ncbi:hypothetical protein KCH_77200 [Kitasatospora cheerisanensis KCTC 2395]|uniref:Uncharacterized protein n=1 Tax=Kitasatospora cheerisanensis KCTC 2395 TaxID=1348663 RepID=A0A066YHA1_9ACTN|nr:hypothetical protein KCH_77200 [Kitasatospora cheerisanensis KCTC 2395]